MFADFNGLPSEDAKTEFYQHDANWSNRMILGDSLQVMASLAEREGLRGKVQCIYIDPPYGIKFNSNFQWSTTSRDVQGRQRRPHHPRARASEGIPRHLAGRDSLVFDLPPRPANSCEHATCLSDSGSIFVQIGDENVHRVRTVDGRGVRRRAICVIPFHSRRQAVPGSAIASRCRQ